MLRDTVFFFLRLCSQVWSSGLYLFALNILGFGFGPQTVGLLSDWLAPSAGEEALRYAMLCLTLCHLWAAVHFGLAGRTLEADLALVTQGHDAWKARLAGGGYSGRITKWTITSGSQTRSV